jgi:hypothetical protein
MSGLQQTELLVMALNSRRFFAAMFALAVAAGAGSAQGAIVTGKLDPYFGGTSPLSGDYFTGVETFSIDNSCLSDSGFVSATAGCGMTFDGATISFYNEDPSIAGATLLGTAHFLPDSVTSEITILGMYIEGGKVVGVQSVVNGSADVTLGGTPYTLDIQFGRTDLTLGKVGGHLPFVVGENVPPFTSLANLTPEALTTLFVENANCIANVGGYDSFCPASAPADTILETFTTQVPEPAVWTMLLVGFGAMGAALRTRRKALLAV